MRTLTASALALAVSLGIGSAAIAGEGVHKDHSKQQHTDKAMMKEEAKRTNAQASSRIDKATNDRLTREFRQLDRDNDGFVMIADLDSAALSRAGLTNVERTELEWFDIDDDRRLDRYEFVTASTATFKNLDRDGNGLLSRAELDTVRPEYVSFVALDSDNDQMLSKQEYRQFIESGDWVRDRDRYAFGYMDRDLSGNIDNQEASIYVPLATRFTAYDPDGDGLIESTEYEVFLAEIDAKQQRGNRVASGEGQLDQDENR